MEKIIINKVCTVAVFVFVANFSIIGGVANAEILDSKNLIDIEFQVAVPSFGIRYSVSSTEKIDTSKTVTYEKSDAYSYSKEYLKDTNTKVSRKQVAAIAADLNSKVVNISGSASDEKLSTTEERETIKQLSAIDYKRRVEEKFSEVTSETINKPDTAGFINVSLIANNRGNSAIELTDIVITLVSYNPLNNSDREVYSFVWNSEPVAGVGIPIKTNGEVETPKAPVKLKVYPRRRGSEPEIGITLTDLPTSMMEDILKKGYFIEAQVQRYTASTADGSLAQDLTAEAKNNNAYIKIAYGDQYVKSFYFKPDGKSMLMDALIEARLAPRRGWSDNGSYLTELDGVASDYTDTKKDIINDPTYNKEWIIASNNKDWELGLDAILEPGDEITIALIKNIDILLYNRPSITIAHKAGFSCSQATSASKAIFVEMTSVPKNSFIAINSLIMRNRFETEEVEAASLYPEEYTGPWIHDEAEFHRHIKSKVHRLKYHPIPLDPHKTPPELELAFASSKINLNEIAKNRSQIYPDGSFVFLISLSDYSRNISENSETLRLYGGTTINTASYGRSASPPRPSAKDAVVGGFPYPFVIADWWVSMAPMRTVQFQEERTFDVWMKIYPPLDINPKDYKLLYKDFINKNITRKFKSLIDKINDNIINIDREPYREPIGVSFIPRNPDICAFKGNDKEADKWPR